MIYCILLKTDLLDIIGLFKIYDIIYQTVGDSVLQHASKTLFYICIHLCIWVCGEFTLVLVKDILIREKYVIIIK